MGEADQGSDVLSRELDVTPRYIEERAAHQSGRKLSFLLTKMEEHEAFVANLSLTISIQVISFNPYRSAAKLIPT